MAELITHKELLERLEYNPDTGIFTWKVSPSNNISIGDIAGCVKKDSGYIVISLKGKSYRAHRLAWFYCFNEWPQNLIDHIDKNTSNNKLENLREATKSQNQQNTNLQCNNTSGYKGVYWHTSAKKFMAQIKILGKNKYLGLYNTAEEAYEAYLKAVPKERKDFL